MPTEVFRSDLDEKFKENLS
jgi:hypothetical protein